MITALPSFRSAWNSHLLPLVLAACALAPLAFAGDSGVLPQPLSLNTDAVGPQRYLAVHGRRSLVSGYATSGLEVWAYPVQIVSGYQVSFRTQGTATKISAASLCRRITYEPESVTRTYIGPGFIVRERIFVPLDEPAAIVTYSVDSRSPVDIVVRFTPVLNLMWPAAIGGQSMRWDDGLAGYVLAEPLRRFTGFVASPETIAHDEIFNAAPTGRAEETAFTIRAGGDGKPDTATVYLGLVEKSDASPSAFKQRLADAHATLENQARTHYEDVLSRSLKITTPDPATNSALAWAEIALDQAWVCNPDLGCGLVAGYGPSRNGRRPQYAWFFAGDGLIATDALVNAGEFARAKQELEFITKYQDPKTGMLWHELSQSAGLLHWVEDFPYMYVHVDITFQYLNAVARYVRASGDSQFAREHWSALEAAYKYCASLLDATDGLPRIPGSKEGGDEQDRLGDELELSSSWVSASQSFAQLARMSGHTNEAADAQRFSDAASKSLAKRYWDSQTKSWIDGYNQSGKPIVIKNIHGASLVKDHVLTSADSKAILDQLASSKFQTDWGTRSVASDSPRFDPDSYAKGSVWGTGTAEVAETFWSGHRPFTAYPIWSTLVPWSSLDSMGHMHEVLAGEFYHQQIESVPEQTWSSALLVSSAIEGLLGLQVQATDNDVTFSPNLPEEWDSISVQHIKAPQGELSLSLKRVGDSLELTAENSGPSINLLYSPEIPLDAEELSAEVNGKPGRVERESHEQDTHAKIETPLPQGTTRCLIRYKGGVLLSVPSPHLLLGEASKAIKITGVSLGDNVVHIQVEVNGAQESNVEMRTTEQVTKVEGANLNVLHGNTYRLAVIPAADKSDKSSYRSVQIGVTLAGTKERR